MPPLPWLHPTSYEHALYSAIATNDCQRVATLLSQLAPSKTSRSSIAVNSGTRDAHLQDPHRPLAEPQLSMRDMILNTASARICQFYPPPSLDNGALAGPESDNRKGQFDNKSDDDDELISPLGLAIVVAGDMLNSTASSAPDDYGNNNKVHAAATKETEEGSCFTVCQLLVDSGACIEGVFAFQKEKRKQNSNPQSTTCEEEMDYNGTTTSTSGGEQVTPLHRAVLTGEEAVAWWVLSALGIFRNNDNKVHATAPPQIDLNSPTRDDEGLTPLHLAVLGAGVALEEARSVKKNQIAGNRQTNQKSIVHGLQIMQRESNGAEDDEAHKENDVFKVYRKRLAIVRLLLMSGADRNAVDATGQTPLFIAAQHDDGAVLEALLHVNPPPHLRLPNTNESTNRHSNPLPAAAHDAALLLYNDLIINQKQQQHQADVLSEGNEGGADRGDGKVVVGEGRSLSVASSPLSVLLFPVDDEAGRTPFHVAAASDSVSILRGMLSSLRQTLKSLSRASSEDPNCEEEEEDAVTACLVDMALKEAVEHTDCGQRIDNNVSRHVASLLSSRPPPSEDARCAVENIAGGFFSADYMGVGLAANTSPQTIANSLHVFGDEEEVEMVGQDGYSVRMNGGSTSPSLSMRAPSFRRETNQEDYSIGMRAIHYAAAHGALAALEFLVLEAGADTNAKTRRDGWTALHYAVSEGHTDCAMFLMQCSRPIVLRHYLKEKFSQEHTQNRRGTASSSMSAPPTTSRLSPTKPKITVIVVITSPTVTNNHYHDHEYLSVEAPSADKGRGVSSNRQKEQLAANRSLFDLLSLIVHHCTVSRETSVSAGTDNKVASYRVPPISILSNLIELVEDRNYMCGGSGGAAVPQRLPTTSGAENRSEDLRSVDETALVITKEQRGAIEAKKPSQHLHLLLRRLARSTSRGSIKVTSARVVDDNHDGVKGSSTEDSSNCSGDESSDSEDDTQRKWNNAQPGRSDSDSSAYSGGFGCVGTRRTRARANDSPHRHREESNERAEAVVLLVSKMKTFGGAACCVDGGSSSSSSSKVHMHGSSYEETVRITLTDLHARTRKSSSNALHFAVLRSRLDLASAYVNALVHADEKGREEEGKEETEKETDVNEQVHVEGEVTIQTASVQGGKRENERRSFVRETKRAIRNLRRVLNTRDAVGYTPLHLAVIQADVEGVAFLLNLTCGSVGRAIRDRKVALGLDTSKYIGRGNNKLISSEKRLASATKRDARGRTPLQVALDLLEADYGYVPTPTVISYQFEDQESQQQPQTPEATVALIAEESAPIRGEEMEEEPPSTCVIDVESPSPPLDGNLNIRPSGTSPSLGVDGARPFAGHGYFAAAGASPVAAVVGGSASASSPLTHVRQFPIIDTCNTLQPTPLLRTALSLDDRHRNRLGDELPTVLEQQSSTTTQDEQVAVLSSSEVVSSSDDKIQQTHHQYPNGNSKSDKSVVTCVRGSGCNRGAVDDASVGHTPSVSKSNSHSRIASAASTWGGSSAHQVAANLTCEVSVVRFGRLKSIVAMLQAAEMM